MRCHVLPIPIHFNGLPDRAAVPTKNSLKSAKSTCRTSSHIPGFDVILAPHTARRPPHIPEQVPISRDISHTFPRRPMQFKGSQHRPPPIGFSRLPHTTTRLTHFPYVLADPHRLTILPYVTPDPHNMPISPYGFRGSPIRSTSSKNPTLISERPASGAANPQPILLSKHPEPALQSSKSSANPTHSNPTDLRLGVAPAPPACARLQVCAHLHGHAPHGHGHTFTGHAHHHVMRKPARRDQRPAQQISNQPCSANILNLRNLSSESISNPIHSNPTDLRYSPADQSPI